jgi:hypothetical protein
MIIERLILNHVEGSGRVLLSRYYSGTHLEELTKTEKITQLTYSALRWRFGPLPDTIRKLYRLGPTHLPMGTGGSFSRSKEARI